MARATVSRKTEAPATETDPAVALLDGWFEAQQRLFGAGMDQWAGAQELWLQTWRQQLDAWSQLWRSDAAPAKGGGASWSDLPAAWVEAVQRASQAYWGPLQPLLQRGGEQLA